MSLDPNISRCAKQVYNHLGLSDRITKFLKPNASFPEIEKMKSLLAMTDKEMLDEIVRGFLRWTPPRQRKKTLKDFTSQIDHEISTLWPEEEEELEEIDEEAIRAIDMSKKEINNKRVATEALEINLNKEGKKKHKVDTANRMKRAQPLECFSTDTSQLEGYNFICSPAKTTKLFSGVSWILLFEIARFLDNCKVPWDEIPFEAFRTFLDTGASEPKKLFDTMMRWNSEVRLGQNLNGVACSRMERCPDSVWSYIQAESGSATTQNDNNKSTEPVIYSSLYIKKVQYQTIRINVNDVEEQTEVKKRLLKNRMIRYSAVITFGTINEVPKITLRTPKISASNRFFRKFGQDRFLEIVLSSSSKPSMVKTAKDFLLKPFLLMQRVYMFLFIKNNTLVFFATEGTGLTPISIQQVIDWHLPITENWDMSMSKYASRMSLGYSSSIPTVQFDKNEIIYIDDIYSDTALVKDDSACMTDGCGIISCAAMKEIMGCQITDAMPCAIQGRIAGAKGVWIIAPDLDFDSGKYIKIRKSQDKFKTGLVQADMHIDPHHYTFDLVKNSICIYPSNLNTQFIQVLSAGGVSTSVFVEILGEYLHRLATVVTENKNMVILRDWLVNTGNVMGRRWESEDQVEKGLWRDLSVEYDMENDLFHMDSDSGEDESKSDGSTIASGQTNLASSRTYDQINRYSGYPGSAFEAVIRMLDSGFDISNAFIATRVTTIFRQLVKSVNTKYKIEVEQSCTVTCIPDPTGLLKSNEIYLKLSTRKVDEKTGIRAGLITGDVLVTRNPCGLKSDIQKVKAIDCPELRESSLASKLSGGDYDGDLIFCCWDERIVAPFSSSFVVKELDRVNEAFEKDKTTVGQLLGSSSNTEKALQSNFINVQMPDSTLGLYENWRTVLAEKSSLDDPEVSYLAQMCAKLVDAPKQGLRLKTTVSMRDRANYSKVPHPTWFAEKKNRQRESNKRSYKDPKDRYKLPQKTTYVTTMDHLYQKLVKETEAFTRYTQSMFSEDDIPLKDPDLVAPFAKAHEYASINNDYELLHDLDLIRNAVLNNMDSYNKQSNQVHLIQEHQKDNLQNSEIEIPEVQSSFASFAELEEYISKEFNNTPNSNSFISAVFQHDAMTNRSRLTQSLKASFAYTTSVSSRKYSKYCYIVAFDALRRIKADACSKRSKDCGFADTVSVKIYKSLNVDRKWIRRIKDSNVVEDSEAQLSISTHT